jgi:hypothetical protein
VTDFSFDDPCVLFALRRESAGFRREFRPQLLFPGAPCWAAFCAPRELPSLQVLLLETGVGRERTEAALRWLFASPMLDNVPYRPKAVLSAGFAGGLQEEVKVGDVILATEIVDAEGERWPATWPGELPAGEWRPALHPGRVLTMPNLVANPEEKHALGRRQEAVAVDMETAVVARRCAEKGVPFGCVRAISDDVHTALSPRLLALLSGGRVSAWRLVIGLLAAPRLTGELWRLAKRTRHAADQLGLALGELLTLTLPWGREL